MKFGIAIEDGLVPMIKRRFLIVVINKYSTYVASWIPIASSPSNSG